MDERVSLLDEGILHVRSSQLLSHSAAQRQGTFGIIPAANPRRTGGGDARHAMSIPLFFLSCRGTGTGLYYKRLYEYGAGVPTRAGGEAVTWAGARRSRG